MKRNPSRIISMLILSSFSFVCPSITSCSATDSDAPFTTHSVSDQQTCFLYAPTRSKKIPAPTAISSSSSCKLCAIMHNLDSPTEFPLTRTKHFTVMLNIYPYGKGHTLIVSNDHIKTIDALTPEQQTELMSLIIVTTTILKDVFKCPGINVGYNEGRCAGASVPDHLHIHILPRYDHYEKSFVHALSNVQVVQWDFKEMQEQLISHFNDIVLKNSH